MPTEIYAYTEWTIVYVVMVDLKVWQYCRITKNGHIEASRTIPLATLKTLA